MTLRTAPIVHERSKRERKMIGAMRFEGYSSVSQSISELSAISAPSRPLWIAAGSIPLRLAMFDFPPNPLLI
jgi:hypothetical protein